MSDEILTSYSGVKLSQDEVDSLIEKDNPLVEQNIKGDEQTPEPEVQVETDQSEPVENVQKEAIDSFELDGKEYEIDTLKDAIEAFENKSEWQKSNTEKAQELSADRKKLEGEMKVWNDLRNNEDAMAALKDVLNEDHPIFSDEVAVAEEEPTQDTKEITKLQELEERLNELTKAREQELMDIQADQQVHADLTKLKQEHPELDNQDFMDQVIKTAVDKGFTGYEGLEDAYALTLHSSAEDSAFRTAVNRARNAKAMKSVPEPEGAVKGIHEEPTTIPKSYKEAQADALKNYNFYE